MLALTLSSLSIGQWAILIIVVAGIIAVVMVIGKSVSLCQLSWICLAVAVGVVAVKFLISVL